MDSVSHEPQPGLLKTIGVFNILIGGLLLLCGAGCLNLFLPRDGLKPLEIQPEIAQGVLDQLRFDRIQTLRQKEVEAKSDEEKAKIRAERIKAESEHPKIEDQLDLKAINADLRSLSTYLWVDVISGPILNMVLFFSGIGLLWRKNWGRLLAIGTAGAKVVRLVVLGVMLMYWVVPRVGGTIDRLLESDMGKELIARSLEQQAGHGAAPMGKPPSPEEIGNLYKSMGRGYALIFMGFGSIYPAIVLIVLNRPGARAACASDRPSDDESEAFGPARGEFS